VGIRLLQYSYPENEFRKMNSTMGCGQYEMPYEKHFSKKNFCITKNIFHDTKTFYEKRFP